MLIHTACARISRANEFAAAAAAAGVIPSLHIFCLFLANARARTLSIKSNMISNESTHARM